MLQQFGDLGGLFCLSVCLNLLSHGVSEKKKTVSFWLRFESLMISGRRVVVVMVVLVFVC